MISRRKFIAALAALPVAVSMPRLRVQKFIPLFGMSYNVTTGASRIEWFDADKIRIVNGSIQTIEGWDYT